MISNEELIQRAKEVTSPKTLSSSVEAGTVGSALVTTDGNLYVGVCIDTACSMGFCAEHNAIGSMITNGESEIQKIVAVHSTKGIVSPCGRCREFMYQVDAYNAKTEIILKNKVISLKGLLPDHWLD